jgi:hypothetical protein
MFGADKRKKIGFCGIMGRQEMSIIIEMFPLGISFRPESFHFSCCCVIQYVECFVFGLSA